MAALAFSSTSFAQLEPEWDFVFVCCPVLVKAQIEWSESEDPTPPCLELQYKDLYYRYIFFWSKMLMTLMLVQIL